MSKKKVFVFGSCVTRDIFNSKFVADWKEYYSLVGTCYQSSLFSVASDPINLTENFFINKENSNWLSSELNKDYWNLINNNQPDIVIFDLFADARFDCISIENTQITNNLWKLKLSETYKNFVSIETEDGQNEYLKRLVKVKNKLEFICPLVKIILVSTRGCTKNKNDKGEINYFNQNYVKNLNRRWDIAENLFLKIFSPIVISMESENLTADANHPWSCAPFHYESIYYRNLFSYLMNVTNTIRKDKITPFLSYDNYLCRIYSDVRLTNRKLIKDHPISMSLSSIKINAGVYKNGCLIPEAMLYKPCGYVQSGSLYEDIWPSLVYEEAIYGGYLIDHVESFLLETLSRLWVKKYLNVPILFQVPEKIKKFLDLPEYMRNIFLRIGIDENNIILIHQASAVGLLYIPEQAPITNGSISWSIREFMVNSDKKYKNLTKSNHVIYIRQNTVKNQCLFSEEEEKKLIDLLNEFRISIIDIDKMSVSDQITILEKAQGVIGMPSSFFYLLLICENIPNKIIYLKNKVCIDANILAINYILKVNVSYLDIFESSFLENFEKILIDS